MRQSMKSVEMRQTPQRQSSPCTGSQAGQRGGAAPRTSSQLVSTMAPVAHRRWSGVSRRWRRVRGLSSRFINVIGASHLRGALGRRIRSPSTVRSECSTVFRYRVAQAMLSPKRSQTQLMSPPVGGSRGGFGPRAALPAQGDAFPREVADDLHECLELDVSGPARRPVGWRGRVRDDRETAGHVCIHRGGGGAAGGAGDPRRAACDRRPGLGDQPGRALLEVLVELPIFPRRRPYVFLKGDVSTPRREAHQCRSRRAASW